MFVGDKGQLLVPAYEPGPVFVEPELQEKYKDAPKTLARSTGHHQEWIDAARGGDAAGSNFAYGAFLTEITLLGVLALRLGKKIDWDNDAMKVTNSDKAEKILKGEYRSGWELS